MFMTRGGGVTVSDSDTSSEKQLFFRLWTSGLWSTPPSAIVHIGSHSPPLWQDVFDEWPLIEPTSYGYNMVTGGHAVKGQLKLLKNPRGEF